MLVEGEVGTHPETVELVAQVGSPHQSVVVQLQTVAVAHEVNLLDVSVFGSVEALETRAFQIQRGGLCDFAGNILGHQFYLVCQRGISATRIELEQQQVVVVPIKDIVPEV